jgi:hypothetical protein
MAAMVRFLQLKPRYLGSFAAMAYGLGMAVSGHVRSAVTMASVGELLFYGALMYHARKRQRFGMKKMWLGLEVYAGLSIVWMAVNILRIQVWRWHPVAFGLLPLVVIGGYLTALIGKPSVPRHPNPLPRWGRGQGEEASPELSRSYKTDTVLTSGVRSKQVSLIMIIAVVWAILNLYAFPKLGIST